MAALKQLISTADVFVTNVRSRALDRAGLGYASLSREYPGLVYAILTAWGLDGPRADDPGYDVGAFWAATGLQDFSKPTDDGHVGQVRPPPPLPSPRCVCNGHACVNTR
jgi:crotonobetainyl-CoA:carnitine CoA-transferase CaiB-like acyl-CoA transferase